MKKENNFFTNCIKVLIVEDESILAIGMEQSLEDLGYEVSGIEFNAKGAIQHVKEHCPDIVIMDINLQGDKSGIEAANSIWKNYKTPVIFLTSYSDDKTIKSAMDSEPYGYLIKPCRDKELKATIETSLHKHNYFYKNKLNITSSDKNHIQFQENFIYDRAKQTLFHNSNPLKLTGKEVKVFELLSECPGEAISFEQISNYIWREEVVDIGRLRTLIYRIKTKTKVELIENIFEVGYRLKIS